MISTVNRNIWLIYCPHTRKKKFTQLIELVTMAMPGRGTLLKTLLFVTSIDAAVLLIPMIFGYKYADLVGFDLA
jgi:hypothetical protein